MDPSSAQPDPPVTRTQQQIVAENFFHIGENIWIGDRMESVGAEVAPDPVNLKGSGIATNPRSSLEDLYLCRPGFAESVCSRDSGGTGAENRHSSLLI